MPMPFIAKEFTFTNPDGTQVRLRGWGNQHQSVFETLDGFTVVKDPKTGFYQYAKLSPDKSKLLATGSKVGEEDPRRLGLAQHIRIRREAARTKAISAPTASPPRGIQRRWEVRRAQKKAQFSAAPRAVGPLPQPPAQQTVGNYVGLCLLIQFPDVSGTISQQEVADFCNKTGYNTNGNNGSVYDYFLDNSGGKLKYTNVVTAYYTAQQQRSHYTDPTVSFGTRTRELITEALTDLKSQGFDFSQLSSDSGGYVYALNVFYAGPCVNDWSEGLWPHSWNLASPFVAASGKKFNDYQITNMGGELRLATFCHENGHMVCDFPDLYDYGYESYGVGNYCLMGYGGTDEKNPSQIGAYLKHEAGWARTVTPITGVMQATISSQKNDFFIYSKTAAECFLIENRQNQGRDAALPDAGLAIWHVDEAGSNDNHQMTAAQHYECSLEQADGRFDLEHAANTGDSEDLFSAPHAVRFNNTTTPNSKWWDGSASGLDVSQISTSGTSMTFRTGGVATKVVQKTSKRKIKIPDCPAAGVRSKIRLVRSAVLNSVAVGIDITHARPRDLRLTLVAPSQTAVVLFDRFNVGGTKLKKKFDLMTTPALAALNGQSINGDWVLQVADLAAGKVGVLNGWGLALEILP